MLLSTKKSLFSLNLSSMITLFIWIISLNTRNVHNRGVSLYLWTVYADAGFLCPPIDGYCRGSSFSSIMSWKWKFSLQIFFRLEKKCQTDFHYIFDVRRPSGIDVNWFRTVFSRLRNIFPASGLQRKLFKRFPSLKVEKRFSFTTRVMHIDSTFQSETKEVSNKNYNQSWRFVSNV